MRECCVCEGPIPRPTTNYFQMQSGSSVIRYYFHTSGSCKEEATKKALESGMDLRTYAGLKVGGQRDRSIEFGIKKMNDKTYSGKMK